jgi:hypothetical protein
MLAFLLVYFQMIGLAFGIGILVVFPLALLGGGCYVLANLGEITRGLLRIVRAA